MKGCCWGGEAEMEHPFDGPKAVRTEARRLRGSLLLANSADVGRVDLVPGRHVLFDAGRHAALFCAREGAAGLGDAFLEAIVLKFLPHQVSWAPRDARTGARNGMTPTSMRVRALARLASAATCFMTDCLTELESMAVTGGEAWRRRGQASGRRADLAAAGIGGVGEEKSLCEVVKRWNC